MCYSIEPREQIYVKGYEFSSFAKHMGKNVRKNYSQKLLNSAKKSTADAIKTASKRATQKTAVATSDLIGNKIADKITSTSKELHLEFSKNLHPLNNLDETDMPKERYVYIYISPEKGSKLLIN